MPFGSECRGKGGGRSAVRCKGRFEVNKARRGIAAAGLLAAALAGGSVPATAASSRSSQSQTVVTCPDMAQATFSHPTRITNVYLPLPVGTTFTSDGKTKGHSLHDVVRVTSRTLNLDGVKTVVVDDEIFQDGSPTEQTFDYFAQDDAGNVWYFGEDSTAIAKNGTTSSDGSWHAGVAGAQPGFIMEADPKVGDAYCQENVPGVAQDEAQVVAVNQSLTVPYATFNNNVLETKEFTPLEPGKTENKFYGRCVGEIESVAITGGTEEQELTSVNPVLTPC